jgi:hypothetical protein
MPIPTVLFRPASQVRRHDMGFGCYCPVHAIECE